MVKYVMLAVLVLAVSGCDSNRGEIEGLQAENQQLRAELDKTKRELDAVLNGPGALLSKARNLVAAKSSREALIVLEELTAKFQSSAEFGEAAALKVQVERALAEELQRKELAEKREAEARRKQVGEALAGLSRQYDRIQEVAFYHAKGGEALSNYIEVYIVVADAGNAWLRQKLHYYGDDWLFIDSYVLLVDGKKYSYGSADFERDNESGSVWEWEDKLVDGLSKEILEAIAVSKEAVIRFQGQQYHQDHTITAGEKKRIKRVLLAYAGFEQK